MAAELLTGRRVLVVEDEYFFAEDVANAFRAAGAEVIGPTGDLDDALALVAGAERLDGAVLDLNLRGEMAFPVADALLARGVPFVFTTGYDRSVIAPRFGAIARCEKPVEACKVVRALFG